MTAESRVDLPEPLGPNRMCTSPLGMHRSIPRNTDFPPTSTHRSLMESKGSIALPFIWTVSQYRPPKNGGPDGQASSTRQQPPHRPWGMYPHSALANEMN